jgi:hypothetical protein
LYLLSTAGRVETNILIMVKNYLKLLVALVFATNVMGQNVTHTFPFTGYQFNIDKFGNLFFINNYKIFCFQKNELKKLYNLTSHPYVTLRVNSNKELIVQAENSFLTFNRNKDSIQELTGGHGVMMYDLLNFDLHKDGSVWYEQYIKSTSKYNGLTRSSDNKHFNTTNSNILNYNEGDIKEINSDIKGNIWILMNQGLSKFDGTDFLNFTSENSGFKTDFKTFICDSIGNLWFGSENGITKFDGTNWINYNSSNSGLLNNNILKIALDHDYKSIWIGTIQGFSHFNGTEWKSYTSSTDSKIMPSGKITVDTSGNLWFVNKGINVLCKKINYNILNGNIQKELTCNNEVMLQTPKGGEKFYWSTGDTTTNLKVKSTGEYSVLIYDSLGCPYSKNIKVNSDELSVGTPSICMVTTENTATKVIWEQTNSNIVAKYNIYRQSSENSTYEKIHEQKLDVLSEYIDNTTNPSIKSYRYKISYVDTCGNETPLSGNHTTILLSSNVGINGTVNLSWNAYEGFVYPNFEIWRSTDGVNFIKIGAVANNSYAYIDNNAPTQAWYQIRITKQDACTPTKRGENYVGSNIISKEGKSLFINELNNETFTVYPNPTKDVITINNAHGNTIKIVDLQGKEVYNALATSAKTEISLKSIGTKGMYILHIVDEKGVSIENKKIVLE